MQLSINDFLKYRKEFSLGDLQTESLNPISKNLSQTLNKNTKEAISILKKIDSIALKKIPQYSQRIFEMQNECQQILSQGGRVFLCGCGATGRLAISLEKIYRMQRGKNNVISFMAGGDFALIKSVESFEDSKEYGKRQLSDLGFNENDILLSITEGGETSFVIGATEYAATISKVNPWFIYCNPDKQLLKIKRSADIILSENVKKLSLDIGAMAISGSTRMQASTVQMIVGGMSILFNHQSLQSLEDELNHLVQSLVEVDYSWLDLFIEAEADLYMNKKTVSYRTSSDLGICVLTDTTERAPTFNLQSFETLSDNYLSWSYLCLDDAKTIAEAWTKLLGRSPRPIEWAEHSKSIGIEKIHEFDLTNSSLDRRIKVDSEMKKFEISNAKNEIVFKFEQIQHRLKLLDNSYFYKHIILKMILNTQSTLVMGKMGRYRGNLMTFVKASNAKLVDRAYRYIKVLLDEENIIYNDEQIIELIFKYRSENVSEGIVNKVFNELKEA